MGTNESKLPQVPGAKGINPEPNPDPMKSLSDLMKMLNCEIAFY
jgi:hypothetical protein